MRDACAGISNTINRTITLNYSDLECETITKVSFDTPMFVMIVNEEEIRLKKDSIMGYRKYKKGMQSTPTIEIYTTFKTFEIHGGEEDIKRACDQLNNYIFHQV